MGMGESYRLALRLAQEELRRAGPDELKRRCLRCGAVLRARQSAYVVELAYLGRPYFISHPQAEVVAGADGSRAAPLWLQIILLHYLNGPATATGSFPAPVAGPQIRGAGADLYREELVPFRDLSGGRVYLPNFEKRVLRRLVKQFGGDPASLLQAGQVVGGKVAAFGDAGVQIPVLPRIPLTFIVWGEDEEFPAQANVLFPAGIEGYLCTEDVIVLCEQVATELIGTARRSEDGAQTHFGGR